MTLALSQPQLLALALVLVLVIALCLGLFAVFVQLRTRTRRSVLGSCQAAASPADTVEEGSIAGPEVDADVDIEKKAQVYHARPSTAVVIQVPVLAFGKVAPPPPAVVARSAVPVVRGVPPRQRVVPVKIPQAEDAVSREVSREHGPSSSSYSPSDSSVVSIALDPLPPPVIADAAGQPVQCNMSLSAEKQGVDVVQPPLATSQAEVAPPCEVIAKHGISSGLESTSSALSATFNSSANIDHQNWRHEDPQLPSSTASTPSLVSGASTPELDSDSSVCWEEQEQTSTPPPSTPATPIPVSSSVYSNKRLSLPFSDAWTEKIQEMDVSESVVDFGVASPEAAPAKAKRPVSLPPPTRPNKAVPARNSQDRRKARPVSLVGLGFNFMLGFDAAAFSLPSEDDLSIFDDDADETIAYTESSQTVTVLSASDSSSSDMDTVVGELVAVDCSKRLLDLVGALETAFSVSSLGLECWGDRLVSDTEAYEENGLPVPRFGEDHQCRYPEAHAYAL